MTSPTRPDHPRSEDEGARSDGPPSLSVVLACRDEALHLPRQLAALRAQEVTGWLETIVVDDGSRDGTPEVAEAHGQGLPGFRVIRRRPTNYATAVNTGIAATSGDAVVFLDGDDEVAPGYLAALQQALADHAAVAARREHQVLNPPWLWAARPHEQVHQLRREPIGPWPVAGGGTIAARRWLLDEVDGYDERLTEGHDTDLCWRMALAGEELVLVPGAVLHYRFRPTPRETFHQARHYGQGGVALELRWATRPGPGRILRRLLRLVTQVGRLPSCVRRSGRAATAFRVGQLVGWLEAAVSPTRYHPAVALQPVTTPSWRSASSTGSPAVT